MTKKASRLRKVVLWTLGVLVVLFLVFQYALGGIIKGGASAAGPAVLGTTIDIENVHARIFSGKVDVKGLVIGPPEGFDANLFEMDNFKIDLDTSSLIGSADKPIVIHEIVIKDPLVSYELKGIHDNLHALLKKLGADENEEVDEEKPSDKEGRKVVIEHFLFEGGRVRVAVANGKGAIVPLPTIELNGIGSKNGGVTGLEATVQILKSITVGTVKAVAGIIADIGGVAVDAVKDVGGVAVGAVKDVGGAAVDGVKSIGKSIGGLFGGSKDEKKADEKEEKADEKETPEE